MKRIVPARERAQDQVEPVMRQLRQQQQESAVTDWAAKEGVALTGISTTLDGIASGVLGLDTLIQNFRNSPGTLGAADQAALDAISSASAALATKASAISTTPPAAPQPTA